jgi:lactoylglutathione lyase
VPSPTPSEQDSCAYVSGNANRFRQKFGLGAKARQIFYSVPPGWRVPRPRPAQYCDTVRNQQHRLGNSGKGFNMRYLHTMIRVGNLDAALEFFCDKLGLKEVRRQENDKGRFTLVFLATPDDAAKVSGEKISALSPMIELTYNWDETEYSGGRNFGHLAYAVDDIYALCAKLKAAGVTINRPPRDGHMAFIRSPDGISVELLQQGDALPPQEPWASMANTGSW